MKRLKEDDELALDPETVRILVAAFDDAWKSVEDSGVTFVSDGHADATREILALRVIDWPGKASATYIACATMLCFT